MNSPSFSNPAEKPILTEVCIGLGSNLGDGRENLLAAWNLLCQTPGIQAGRLSHPYSSKPVDMENNRWFTNAAGVLYTSLSPEALLSRMLEIEQILGRDRSKGKDRTIDLDLLFFGDNIISDPRLDVPHPAITERLFVLAPLAEVAPDSMHPSSRKNVSRMLQECTDPEQEIIPLEWPEGNIHQ